MARRSLFLPLVCLACVITAVRASAQVMPSPLQVTETSGPSGTITGTWTFTGTTGQGAWNNGASAALTVNAYDGVNVTISRVDGPGSTSSGLTAIYTGQRSDNTFAGAVTWTSLAGLPVTGTWTATFAAPPTNLYARLIAGNGVTLRWTPPAGEPTPTGYILEGGVTPGAPLASLSTGLVEPVAVFNAPTGTFYIQIRTVAGGQVSAPSNEIAIHVNMPVPPSPPAGLTGMVTGQTVALAWRNTYAGGTPQNVILDVSGTLSGSVPIGPVESFTFNGVPGGVYTFSVRAANASGVSTSSNAVTLAFPQQCTGAPSTPANFLATKGIDILSVIWDPASTGQAPTHFMLHVSGTFNLSVPLTSRGLDAPGLPPGIYTLSVSGVNACGSSAATSPITLTIP